MSRPRTLRTLIARIGDSQLKALWDLRSTIHRSYSGDHKIVRDAIRERIHDLKQMRGL